MADVNGFDPVPLAVDGGRIDGAALRRLAYAASSGSEGIVSVGDLKVHELPLAPGGQVVIDSGAVVYRNRSAGVRNESYMASASQESRLDVAPNLTSSPRSDLVVIRVEDPQFPGWSAPPAVDAPTYQYSRPVIIPNVPAATKRFSQLQLQTPYSAYAAARIDIPAETSTITDDMIVDLRKMAQPRRQREHDRLDGPIGQIDHADLRRLWNWISIDVPDWASAAIIRADLQNVQIRNSAFAGLLSAAIGPDAGPRARTRDTYINEQVFGSQRVSYVASDHVTIPASLRGTTQDFYMLGQRIGGAGILLAESDCQLIFDVEFIESAV